MKSPQPACRCGRPVVFMGRCALCFSEFTETIRSDNRSTQVGTFEPGQRFGGGRFTLVEPLGQGGMGSVWLANDEHLSKTGGLEQVALKFITVHQALDLESVELLRREVKSSLRLSHPHIVRVHSWFEPPGEPVFYSMEFVPGIDLRRLLEVQAMGRFSCVELEPLILQLVEALNYAHGTVGLVHRDLKPANLLVTPSGILKIVDFGLARQNQGFGSLVTTRGGTLAYASPQQLRSEAPCVSDDIYSVGALLYHLLTGYLPFSPEDLTREDLPEAIHPWKVLRSDKRSDRGVSAEAAETLIRCLSRNKEDRPPDVKTFWKWWKAGPPESITTNLGGSRGGKADKKTFWSGWGSGTPERRRLANMLSVLLGVALLGLTVRFGDRAGAMFKGWLSKRSNTSSDPKNPELTPDVKGSNEPVQPRNPTSERKLTNVLTLQIIGPDPAGIRVNLYQIETFEQPRAGMLQATELFSSNGLFTIRDLKRGRYRVEAGMSSGNSHEDWIQQFVEVNSGEQTVTIDFRPKFVSLFINHPVPFLIANAWGESVAEVAPENLQSPIPTDLGKRWMVGRVRVHGADQRLMLKPGYYYLKIPSRILSELRIEDIEYAFLVKAGQVKTNIAIVLTPWKKPRMDQVWTNTVGMCLLPVPGPTALLASRTETTVIQYSQFFIGRHSPTELLHSMESITREGSVNIGRNWKDAFPEQTMDHPVVGVTWYDADNFCRWLTSEEQSHGRLDNDMEYRLPTNEEWSRIAGATLDPWGTKKEQPHGRLDNDTESRPSTNEEWSRIAVATPYPWGTNFPPTMEQGNFAGLELQARDDWPKNWDRLLINKYRDNTSVHTVASYHYAKPANEFVHLGGNAAEWSASWYKSGLNAMTSWSVPSARLMDDGGGETYRSVRGGSWFDSDPDILRTQSVWAEKPETANDRIGFRVVLIRKP